MSALLLGVAVTWTCAIYGLLVAATGHGGGRAPKLAVMRVREADHATAMYVIDHGRCPRAAADLVGEGYLGPQGARDPWGTTIAIFCSADEWSARSAGADRAFGTADDVSSRY